MLSNNDFKKSIFFEELLSLVFRFLFVEFFQIDDKLQLPFKCLNLYRSKEFVHATISFSFAQSNEPIQMSCSLNFLDSFRFSAFETVCAFVNLQTFVQIHIKYKPNIFVSIEICLIYVIGIDMLGNFIE